ncbi:hypothetical protein H8356DRAFT_1682025 [Neocallimastix lanati (nom. inval.)]|nr:hypothetical protein H8356DRAFT_1682025 [Neocallimastix sp. JGI-2020a]
MIYIVSPNQIPDFIDVDHPRIKIINQDDLLPPHVAPTFNSFVIELYLDKVPGITERFIQLNDDYFFNNYCHPSFFFSSKNFYPKFYHTNRKIQFDRVSAENIAKKKNSSMISKFHGSVYNTNDAVKKAFGKKATLNWLDHSPYCWYRDLYEPARKVYESQVRETLLHKFRHPLDLVPTYAYQAFIQYATASKNFPKNVGGSGRAKDLAPLEINGNRTITNYSYEIVPQNVRNKVIKFGSILNNVEKNKKLFDRIIGSTFIMYNLNDDYQKKEALYQLINFMKTQYPVPSSFEKKEYLEQEIDLETSINSNAKITGDSATQNINENGENVNVNDDTYHSNSTETDPQDTSLNSSSNPNPNATSVQVQPNLSNRESEEINFLLSYHGEELSEEWKWAEEISIVYIWTNSSDPEYIKLRKEYSQEKFNTSIKRYDELQYSLRSLNKYLPWHKGKIYIITPGQTPSWLDTSYKRIEIIHQNVILPLEAIPTFNIFVLEMYLDKIPGITERFLYLNNNHYFKNYTHPRLFFSKDFSPKYYLNGKINDSTEKAIEISQNKILKNFKKYQASLYYTNGIVKEIFGNSINIRQIERTPYAWYRDLFEPSRNVYKKYVDETIHHKFINTLDIIPTYAIQSFNIYGAANPFFPEIIGGDGKAYREYSNIKLNENRTINFYGYDIVSPNVRSKTIITYSLDRNQTKNLEKYKMIEESSVIFFSIKLQGNEKDYFKNLFDFINRMYPEKPSFEK